MPPDAAAAVAASGGSATLVAGLASADPEVACLAAEGVGALAGQGGAAAQRLAEHFGLHEALFRLVDAPQRVASATAARGARSACSACCAVLCYAMYAGC